MLEQQPGEKPGPDRIIKRTPRTKQPTVLRSESDEIRKGQMTTAGKILAACPMTPDELADAWNVAANDVETITVKILRQKMGTQEQELMDSVPLVDFDGDTIAGNFGPGTYYLRPSGRKYAKHAAKLPISEALAKAAGWGRIPVTAQDMQAERTLRQAVEGPTNPVDLLAAIEQVMDRRDAERGRMALVPATSGAVDPFAAMQSQFAQIRGMMEFMGSLEERAIKTVEMRMGRNDVSISAEDTNTSLLEKLLPKALDIFGQMMSNRNPAPVMQQPAPGHDQVQHQAPPIKVVSEPHQEVKTMPTLTQEEQNAIGGAVGMLRPFAGYLVSMAASTSDDQAVADELAGFVPDNLIPSLVALCGVVNAHGHDVLAAIHSGIASPRWALILNMLVTKLQEV